MVKTVAGILLFCITVFCIDKYAEAFGEEYLLLDLCPNNGTGFSFLNKKPDGGWGDIYKTRYIVFKKITVRNLKNLSPKLRVSEACPFYYMGVFEVTQRQWELVMGTRPSYYANKQHYATRPIENVSYRDVKGTIPGDKSFIAMLELISGVTGFDLPTESEWEYASRGDSQGFFNPDQSLSALVSNAATIARVFESTPSSSMYVGDWNAKMEFHRMFNGKLIRNFSPSNGGTAKVGSYPPNSLGLHDMMGNVSELCVGTWRDVDNFGRRLIKGGSWKKPLWEASFVARSYVISDDVRSSDIGVRLVFIPQINMQQSENFIGLQRPSIGFVVDGEIRRTESGVITNCLDAPLRITNVNVGTLPVNIVLAKKEIPPHGDLLIKVTLENGFENAVFRDQYLFKATVSLEVDDEQIGEIAIPLTGCFLQ